MIFLRREMRKAQTSFIRRRNAMGVLKVAGLACFLGLSFIGSAFATTRYVNVSNATPAAPYTNWGIASTNIQGAIDAAASGDEILVAPGTYWVTSSVDITAGKTLTLRSTQSRAAIIDAQGLCTALSIRGTNSLVEGFTVRKGFNSSYAGGVFMRNSSTLRNCLVTSNQAYGGAGVHIYIAATVENCTIQSNLATYCGGGVIFYSGTTGVVRNCTISDNVASNYGGGAYIQYGGMLSNCWISNNRVIVSYGDGGGVHMSAQGTTNGGTIVNSVICDNSSSQDGGGIFCRGGTGNMAPVVNCTVVSNSAGRLGGGISASDARLINNIVYYNAAPTGENLYQDSPTAVASNCCVIPMPATNGLTCFTNAPAFVDYAARNLHLAAGSSCIDAGAATNAPGNDYAGNPRPAPGVLGGAALFDVGAFEYQLPIEVCDGIDNDGDSQVDEDCRSSSSYFSANQSVACTGAGWSRTFVMDLTNFRNIAVQDGYQSYTVNYSLFYNIWTGIYLYDYVAGAFSSLTWLTNLDL
jgi:parallel beta-helix repeat protein